MRFLRIFRFYLKFQFRPKQDSNYSQCDSEQNPTGKFLVQVRLK